MKQIYLFRKVSRFFHSIICLAFIQPLFAQQTPALPDTSQMAYNQISQRLNVVVFPAKGQSQQKQKEDEFECYKWAIQQSGIDPLNLPKVEAAPAQSGPTGSGVRGAARGAAAGAAVGAIAGDASEGAAIGAVGGAVAGRRRGKQAQAQQNQQAQASASEQQQEIRSQYLRAFAGCIEGKGYSVK